MGWEIGFDSKWDRDIGYGVPAECDHPDCDAQIDRGLAYVCGSEPHGGEHGCGLFFCARHLSFGTDEPDEPEDEPEIDPSAESPPVDRYETWQECERCAASQEPFEPKPDVKEWLDFKETDPSWAEWRAKRT